MEVTNNNICAVLPFTRSVPTLIKILTEDQIILVIFFFSSIKSKFEEKERKNEWKERMTLKNGGLLKSYV